MSRMELRGAGKVYEKLRVIDELDLSVEDGSFTVFVGPSGCGKSTLLRMIAGLEHISDGELLIDGVRMNEATPVGRGVAMVFQNYALYPHMNVERNIGFGLKMAGLGRADIRERVAAAAAILKIEPLLKRRPAALSGGQRQRVAIGRAIVREPGLFLFDEPLSNLDAELRVAMRVEIAKLHRSLGSTMIYVTHDQTEAMTLADTIVVLHDGRIEQTGSPVELYEDPDNLFVAGFIGSPRMNFLPGTVRRDGAEVIVSTASGESLRLRPLEADRWRDGGAVQIGARPEDFGTLDAANGSSLSVRVTVDVVENLGGMRYVYGQLRDHGAEEPSVALEYRGKSPPRAGEPFEASVPLERLRFFDDEGNRLRVVS